MAFQTEVSSTLSPSSTDSPSDSNNSGSNTQPGFSLSASPPLILAFLAVGMFGIAMIVFFGWRRISNGRNSWTDPSEVVPVIFGETPKLWEVWSPQKRTREEDTAKWRDIQPLAATVWDDIPSVPVDSDRNPRHDSLLAQAIAHLRRTYRRRRPDAGIAMEAKFGQAPPLGRLQIAIAIVMPSAEPDLPLDYLFVYFDTSPLCQNW
ncbi:hypothetical protein C8R43DRAFT_1008482 [Mycena crocata]|nr:hypothetical protein C8R43DRAFT_1008482 [Mycena crocata]